MKEHTPSGAEDFSEERFPSKLQSLLGKVCYSDNDVHLALEETSKTRSGAFPLETFKRISLDKM